MSKNEFVLSGGQSHEIEMAMNRLKNGKWTPELVQLLTKGDTLGKILEVLAGRTSNIDLGYIIDCDADPGTPYPCSKVKVHQKGEFLKWDPSQIKLHVPDCQTQSFVPGKDLLSSLAHEKVLNANVLDYLLKNRHLIPEEWKSKRVFFFGTIYLDEHGTNPYVRYLTYTETSPDEGYWSDMSQPLVFALGEQGAVAVQVGS